MKRALRKCLLDGGGEDWDEHLPYIAMGYKMSNPGPTPKPGRELGKGYKRFGGLHPTPNPNFNYFGVAHYVELQ